ncbi:multinuclear nonheme iron-dependent oxidase, partial [Pseudomonas aeruginosa]
MIGKQGIGLRSGHQSILSTQKVDGIDFLELSPENWMGLGGFKQVYLDKVASIYPLI